MLISLEWLKDYVDIEDIEPNNLAERLVLTGTNLEEIKNMGDLIENIVVSQVIEITKHPNADKLSICKAKIGKEDDEWVQILTTARNMKEGDYIPLAKAPSKLADGTVIKKSKMRGEESNGMFCSYQELGFNENVVPKKALEGLLIMEEFPYGMDIKEALSLNDTVIDFEITPNRPDCLSVLGVAREVAITFGKELKLPDNKIKNQKDSINKYAKVSVNSKFCKRYIAKMADNVKIEPSPMWLQLRLMKAGVRPINNIVDITNYVLMELGQPIHAFDLDKIENSHINVRMAKDNEKFVTLDGEERILDSSMLVIADETKPVALAGIMGGEYSGISEDTKRILIEVANFDKNNIRETSKKIGLRSESSARFEKGIDEDNLDFVMDRICNLIELLNAGEIIDEKIDVCNEKFENTIVDVRIGRIKTLIGENIEDEKVIDIIKKIGCQILQNDEKILKVWVPSYRNDIKSEIDFVEEVARFYGYNSLSFDLPSNKIMSKKTKEQKVYDITLDTLVNSGLYEFKTYSFTTPKMFNKLKMCEEIINNEILVIKNPLGEEFSIMRNNLMHNLLDVVNYNLKRQNDEIFGFEIGNVFKKNDEKAKNVDDFAIETMNLGIVLCSSDTNFFDLKTILEKLLYKLSIRNYEINRVDNNNLYHSGRCAKILVDCVELAVFGEVHPNICENFEIKQKVYYADVKFEELIKLANFNSKYIPLPKYPKATRDIAILVDENITHKMIEDKINSLNIKILEDIELFDVYRGDKIEKGKKSMAYSLTFRDKNDTLNDEQIKKSYDKIVNKLKEDLSAILR